LYPSAPEVIHIQLSTSQATANTSSCSVRQALRQPSLLWLLLVRQQRSQAGMLLHRPAHDLLQLLVQSAQQ
jgi:hypothetical protein